MSTQKPSIARIVLYVLNELDVRHINRRRGNPALAHMSEEIRSGDTFPMIITRVDSTGTVAGQVFLDGTDTYWVNACRESHEGQPPTGDDRPQEGHWHWVPRV